MGGKYIREIRIHGGPLGFSRVQVVEVDAATGKPEGARELQSGDALDQILTNGMVDTVANVAALEADKAQLQTDLDKAAADLAAAQSEIAALQGVAASSVRIVSMAQTREVLRRHGYLATIDQAIANMPGEEGETARIAWEYSTEIREDATLVTAMAQILSLDDAGKAGLFDEALAITF
jgi:hypothetical protein